jgi:molecular chaperone GrpE
MSEQPVDQGQPEEQAVEEDLDALLSDVKRERDEYLALAQRAKADFENYRKRAAREASEAERRGRASVARELVAPMDNLERALRAAGIDPEEKRTSDGEAPSEEVSAQEALARGLALVYGELQAALARTGIESYDPAGERFDPSSSEAVSTRPADGAESGVVVETLERGYRIGDHVLRPARVVVAE